MLVSALTNSPSKRTDLRETANSRREALACGFPRYVSKKACAHCGTYVKYTSKSSCVECFATRRATQKHKTYRSWYDMLLRCYDEDRDMYPAYGGRGIRVCDRWQDPDDGYENFLADMGEAPVGHTIDRIDPNGHYCPENCRWLTPVAQARNTTKTALSYEDAVRLIHEWETCTKHGDKKTLAAKYGVSHALASYTANRSALAREVLGDAFRH